MASSSTQNSQSIFSINCALARDDNNKIVRFSDSIQVPKEAGASVRDRRLNMVVVKPTYDLNMYHNYLGAVSELIREDWLGDPNKTGRWVDMLNMGYLPIFMSPSFVSKVDDVTISVINAIKTRLNYKIIRHAPYRLDGARVETANMDVYVSKIEVHKRMGIAYSDMSSQRVLQELAHQAFQ